MGYRISPVCDNGTKSRFGSKPQHIVAWSFWEGLQVSGWLRPSVGRMLAGRHPAMLFIGQHQLGNFSPL